MIVSRPNSPTHYRAEEQLERAREEIAEWRAKGGFRGPEGEPLPPTDYDPIFDEDDMSFGLAAIFESFERVGLFEETYGEHVERELRRQGRTLANLQHKHWPLEPMDGIDIRPSNRDPKWDLRRTMAPLRYPDPTQGLPIAGV